MGTIGAGDLALLRQPIDQQKTVERLYTMGFDPVWTGRVNDATIARGDRSIVYDGGAMSGTFVWADLAAFDDGLEVWFGSSAGAYDVGRRRLRSMGAAAAAGTMVTDWYDDMELSDDDYITIVHNYPAWPKYSWFTTTGPVFRKDGPDGTTYAASGDANDTPAPHVIMGRHYANELTGASLAISFDATNTVDVAGGGGGYSYAWDITPPTNASFDNAAIGAPTLTVTDEGRWWVHVTVTIDGRSTTAHRAVIVGGGVTEFERGPISCQYDNTSLTCQIASTSPDSGGSEIRPEVDWSDFEDHALVIITADDWYGTTNKSIDFRDDGVYDDRHHIVFTGYLMLENDDFQSTGAGQVQMQAVSLMDMFVYSLSLTGVTNATDWYEMNDDLMTVAGNLLHLFRWHSTLLDISDWWFPWSDTVKRSANEEFGEGDIMERARALCRARIMGMTVNPQGEVFVETDLNVRTAAERAAETTTLTLTEADIANDKRVRIRRRGDLIRVILDGGYSTGVMGSFQPYFSASQEVARAEGRPALVHLDRLMLPSQTEGNRLSGRIAAVANRKYSEVNLDFSGNYREIFSPADQQWTNLGNVFASSLKANLRGFDDLESAKVVPRQVTHNHDNKTGATTVSAIFDVEAPVELTGVTITPPEVPSENPEDGTWDFPDAPDWPAIPEIAFTGSLVAFDGAEGCWVRLPDATDWEERNGTRTGTDDDDVQGGWDPHWFTPAKQNSTDPNQAILWATQDGKIWRSTDCGVTWTDMTPFITDDPPNDWGDAIAPTVADVTFVQRTDNIHANGHHYFTAEWQEAGGDWRGWLLVTEDDGATWEWISLFDLTDGGDWVDAEVVGSGGFNIDDEVDNPTYIQLADGNYAEFWCPGGGTCSGGYIDAEWGGGVEFPNSAVRVRWRAKMTSPRAESPYECRFHWNDEATGGTDLEWFDGTRDPFDGSAYEISTSKNFYSATGNNVTMRIRYGAWAFPDPPSSTHGYLDYVQMNAADLSITQYYDEIRPIWMDVDSQDGTVLYMTAWADDNLYLWIFDLTDLTASPTEIGLGSCTIAQLNARTYVAYPYTPTFDKSTAYVFGRMNDPQSLGNPSHLIRTTDGGTSWSLLEGGFGADYVGAFRAEGETAGDRTFNAVRNDGAGGALYVGHETLTYRIDLPFAADVTVDAFTVNPDGQVAVGSSGTNDIQIIEAPWSSWTDITDSFPGSAVSSLTYL